MPKPDTRSQLCKISLEIRDYTLAAFYDLSLTTRYLAEYILNHRALDETSSELLTAIRFLDEKPEVDPNLSLSVGLYYQEKDPHLMQYYAIKALALDTHMIIEPFKLSPDLCLMAAKIIECDPGFIFYFAAHARTEIPLKPKNEWGQLYALEQEFKANPSISLLIELEKLLVNEPELPATTQRIFKKCIVQLCYAIIADNQVSLEIRNQAILIVAHFFYMESCRANTLELSLPYLDEAITLCDSLGKMDDLTIINPLYLDLCKAKEKYLPTFLEIWYFYLKRVHAVKHWMTDNQALLSELNDCVYRHTFVLKSYQLAQQYFQQGSHEPDLKDAITLLQGAINLSHHLELNYHPLMFDFLVETCQKLTDKLNDLVKIKKCYEQAFDDIKVFWVIPDKKLYLTKFIYAFGKALEPFDKLSAFVNYEKAAELGLTEAWFDVLRIKLENKSLLNVSFSSHQFALAVERFSNTLKNPIELRSLTGIQDAMQNLKKIKKLLENKDDLFLERYNILKYQYLKALTQLNDPLAMLRLAKWHIHSQTSFDNIFYPVMDLFLSAMVISLERHQVAVIQLAMNDCLNFLRSIGKVELLNSSSPGVLDKVLYVFARFFNYIMTFKDAGESKILYQLLHMCTNCGVSEIEYAAKYCILQILKSQVTPRNILKFFTNTIFNWNTIRHYEAMFALLPSFSFIQERMMTLITKLSTLSPDFDVSFAPASSSSLLPIPPEPPTEIALKPAFPAL